MKKYAYLLVLAIVILIGVGAYKLYRHHHWLILSVPIETVDRVVIMYGNNGHTVTLTDSTEIKSILEGIVNNKMTSSRAPSVSGYSYNLTMYSNGEKVDSFTFYSDKVISHGKRIYSPVEGRFDIFYHIASYFVIT